MNVYGKLQVAKYYNFGTLNFWSRDLTDYNQEDALFDVLEWKYAGLGNLYMVNDLKSLQYPPP